MFIQITLCPKTVSILLLNFTDDMQDAGDHDVHAQTYVMLGVGNAANMLYTIFN